MLRKLKYMQLNTTAKLKLAAAVILLLTSFFSINGTELICITEVLKDPIGLESAPGGGKSHEFVEMTNFGTDTFFIDSLFVSDGVESDGVISFTSLLSYHNNCLINTSKIPPGYTAVILDPDYALAPAAGAFIIDSGTILLTIDDSEIGNGLSVNDGVFLFNGSKTTAVRTIASFVDENQILQPSGNSLVQMSPPGIHEGFSIIPRTLLSQPTVFEPCPDSLSLGHYEFDRSGWLLEYRLGAIMADSTVQCSVFCTKTVTALIGSATLTVTSTENGQLIAPLFINTGTINRYSIQIPLTDHHYQIILSNQNQQLTLPLDISSAYIPAGAIRITEVFPRATTTIPEWFEITNTSRLPINLKNWQFGSTLQTYEITAQNLLLAPGKYLIIASNQTLLRDQFSFCPTITEPLRWSSLDNYNDTLILRSNRNQTCETICYHSSWFTAWDNQSIVSVSRNKSGTDRTGWTLSPTPSPGLPNADSLLYSTTAPTMHIGPIPFSPNGDNHDDQLAITLLLPVTANASITIWGFNGTKYQTFSQLAKGTILWSGTLENGQPAPAGPFFVVAEIKDDHATARIRHTGVLWR